MLKFWKIAKFWIFIWKILKSRTVDSKISAVVCDAAFVWSMASVIASMTRFNSVNGKHADFLRVSRDQNPVVCGQILPNEIAVFVECPPNFDGQIAFCDRTSCSDRFVEVQFFFPKRKRNNCWQNFFKKSQINILKFQVSGNKLQNSSEV